MVEIVARRPPCRKSHAFIAVFPLSRRTRLGVSGLECLPMRPIGIDARKLADFGIGSYLQGLLGELVALDPPGGVALLVSRENMALLPALPETWRLVEVEAGGYTIREQFSVLFAAMRAGVEVLHVPHYVLPLAYPLRMVVTIHDIIHILFPEFLPHPLGFGYARLLIRTAVRRARRVIAVSQTTADDLIHLFGAQPNRVTVIPDGIAPEFLSAGDEVRDGELRRRIHLPDRYLLHVGNNKPHKNVEGLLKAYQMLVYGQRQGLPPLVLAGGFARDGEIDVRARAMGLGRHVHCLGHLEQTELAAVFRGAAAFVYPTLYEGFGLTVLEAMGCGVPVVAGDVPAVREIAGDAVVRVNPRDVTEIADAVMRVLDRPDLRAELSERGQARARRYQWRRAAEATLAVYREAREEKA